MPFKKLGCQLGNHLGITSFSWLSLDRPVACEDALAMIPMPYQSCVFFLDHHLGHVHIEGVFEGQVDDVDHLALADAAAAIFALGQSGRVPVNLQKYDSGGPGKGDASTCGLETSDEDTFLSGLETPDEAVAIFHGGLAVEQKCLLFVMVVGSPRTSS